MKIKNGLLIITFLLTLTSCLGGKKDTPPPVTYVACTDSAMISGLCIRYMDRKIYFARNLFSEPRTNSEFDVEKVKDALNNLASNTDLGEGYFSFAMADKTELNLIMEEVEGLKFKSFIQIWPDIEFNDLYSTLPSTDPNAILVVNQANKKQFFLILRESCFTTNNANCTNVSGTTFSPNKGLYGLVSRSFSRMIGVPVKDCTLYPVHAMCSLTPSDAQWSLAESDRLYDIFNNQLETIRNNNHFYDVFFAE